MPTQSTGWVSIIPYISFSFFLKARRRTPTTVGMASNVVVSCSIFLLIFTCSSAISPSASNPNMFPMACSSVKKCEASLYHVSNGHLESEIAAAYSVNSSQVKPMVQGNTQDYLITGPCSCESADGVAGTAYFHDASFRVNFGDTLDKVADQNYSGQVWIGEEPVLNPGEDLPVKLLCGCLEDESEIVVTYTVQSQDTISQIASLFSAEAREIVDLNRNLIKRNPSFIEANWVLFVPMQKNPNQSQAKGNSH